MNSTIVVILAISSWTAFDISRAFASTLYGSTSGSEFTSLYTVDQHSGHLTQFGPVAGFPTADLTSDWRPESFRIWGTVLGHFLIRIDPVTGNQTNVGTFSVFGVSQLAFDVTTGALYGADGNRLYRIDPDTAVSTFIGSTGSAAIGGLSFDLTGTLYGVTFPDSVLVKIDPATGNAQPIGSTGYYSVGDLAVRPEDGVMFGVGTPSFSAPVVSNLVRVNTDTGATTIVGPLVTAPGSYVPMTGVAFSPAVPEPSPILLLAISIAFFGSRRSTRCRCGR
jgi:hypothetical protein